MPFKTFAKALLFPLYLCGVILFSVLVPFGDLLPSALAAGAENIGHVSRVKGVAYALHEGELLQLEHGTLVRRTDVLKTGPDARVEITMLDETRLTLGADTVLALERYDLGRQPGPGAALLLLTKGAFRVVTGQFVALRGGPFEVVTPFGTIGVRGTDFWGGFLAPEELGVLLISGSGVYIRNDGGTSEIVRPLEGVRLTSPTAPPPQPTLWSPARRAQAFKTVAFD